MNRVSLTLLLVITACTKAEDVSSELQKREVRAASARAIAPYAPAATPARTPGKLEQRLLDLASCGIEGHQITATCPAMEALAREIAAPGSSKELSLELGKRLLANPSPAVRLETAKLMGADRASRDAIVEVARTDAHPGVRQALVRELADEGARNPSVASMLFAASSHPEVAVRREAVAALTSPANRSLPGGAERLVAIVESDPDPALRREACTQAGKLGNPVLLPMYERATASVADPAQYAACMEGLVAMFHNPPMFDTSNEQAYRMFLRELSETPRSEASPPWSVTSAFCYYSHEADLTKLSAWKQQAPWFDATEVKQVMGSVITDTAASWQARVAAVESMVGLGATKAELASLSSAVVGKGDDDRRVVAKIRSVLAP